MNDEILSTGNAIRAMILDLYCTYDQAAEIVGMVTHPDITGVAELTTPHAIYHMVGAFLIRTSV